jgi:uncharacterized protein YjbJ (UPF0337 family)
MSENNRTRKVANDATTRAKNAAQVTKGQIKVKAGKLLGDRGLETQGKLDTAKGRVKQVGHQIKKAIDD